MFREITRAAILCFTYIGFLDDWFVGRCRGPKLDIKEVFLFIAAAEDPCVIVLDGREAPL